MERLSTVARIIIDGKPYLVLRDTSVEGMTISGGFGHVLRRLFIEDINGSNLIGCIVFYLDFPSSFSWEANENSLYGSNERLEYSLANLLPHLDIGIKHINEAFKRSGQQCIICNLNGNISGFNEDKINYSIQLKDNFFKTAQELVFKGGVTRKKAKREILTILLNGLEENPNTYILIDNLKSSIPLTTKELFFQLHILKEEDMIDFVASPSDPQKIISVKIKAKGVKELEAESDTGLQYPQMVKQVFGTNIENTTYGPNSPITVSIEQIKTVFDALQKEIQEHPQISNKVELSEIVKELETEITKKENPNKVKELLEKVKVSADWVYTRLINNPIISGIIVDLLIKTTHM